MGRFAPTRKLYCDADGAPLGPGAVVKNPDMARTLRRIAEGGAEIFYTGDIAHEIDADMAANGGLLSKQDLAAYRTVHGAPLWGEYRDLEVATNQPPGGGIMLVEMLNILEDFDLAALGHNSPEYIRVVCEAMKRAVRSVYRVRTRARLPARRELAVQSDPRVRADPRCRWPAARG